jgi:hypothetical protein
MGVFISFVLGLVNLFFNVPLLAELEKETGWPIYILVLGFFLCGLCFGIGFSLIFKKDR